MLRCVLYLGCSTGLDYSHSTGIYNLVDATFEKGAHFVLGTTDTVNVAISNAFLEGFLSKIDDNGSILECISEGLSRSEGYPITYRGDTSQYLN